MGTVAPCWYWFNCSINFVFFFLCFTIDVWQLIWLFATMLWWKFHNLIVNHNFIGLARYSWLWCVVVPLGDLYLRHPYAWCWHYCPCGSASEVFHFALCCPSSWTWSECYHCYIDGAKEQIDEPSGFLLSFASQKCQWSAVNLVGASRIMNWGKCWNFVLWRFMKNI